MSAERQDSLTSSDFSELEFTALIHEQIGIAIAADDLSRDLDQVAGWDSLHLITLLGALEQRVGRSLPLPDFLEARTLRDIYDTLGVAPATAPSPGAVLSGFRAGSRRSISVAITGHGTLDALGAALTAELTRHGFRPAIRMAEFGSYVFELGDPAGPLYTQPTDLTICVLDHAVVLDEVGAPFTVDDVQRVCAEKLALLRALVAQFESGNSGWLVLNTMALPRSVSAQILDYRNRSRLGAVWRAFNTELLGLSSDAVVVLDIEPLLTTAVPLVDARMDTYISAHLSQPLLADYARELAHLIRARNGMAKKVLAVDLDQTLWGGILGDDGIDGIDIGHTGRGEAFRRFQSLIAQLRSQGVLVAAVSKNDRERVLEVLREHPDMVLRADDFVQVLADWGPKSAHVKALAESLNLGMDSVVFVDDSVHECAQVAAALPEVTVVHLAGDPADHGAALLAHDWFTVPALTEEDGARTRLYREEAARSEFCSNADTLSDFLAGLQLSVKVTSVGESDVARVSQLTLRTNQFNLTTVRLSPDEVAEYTRDPDSRALAISARDRFGSNGIVGAIFLRTEADVLVIDNFLLSCRVFGRGIEQAAMHAILAEAGRRGIRSVTGAFRPTDKNKRCESFYPDHGFTVLSTRPDGIEYGHELREQVPIPEHVSLEVTDGGVVPRSRSLPA